MSDSDPVSQSAENVEILRKRLRYQSWHRGRRETDLLLGRFADRHLADFDAEQLRCYAILMEQNDADLFDWVSRKKALPEYLESDVMTLLLNFKFHEITS
jgi:antitoxin CptB